MWKFRQSRNLILYGAISNIALALLKTMAGFLGQSHALLADGLHSFADLIIDAFVYFSAKYGGQDADEDHPYGHARIETAATVLLAIFLVLIGSGIALDAIRGYLNNQHNFVPKFYTLGVVILALVVKEILYFWSMAIARQLNSELLKANAWHHRSDSASSLVVLIGIAAALLGFTIFDVIAAVIVGILIIKMAWSLAWQGLRELVDTGLPPQHLNRLKQTIHKTSGVRALHQLRTRSMGGATLLDVHILVEPDITVSEGHFISERVQINLLSTGLVKDVVVHVDPEEDVYDSQTFFAEAPLRSELIPQLMQAWKELPFIANLHRIQLHYLMNQIQVDIYFHFIDNKQIVEWRELQTRYFNSIANIKYINSVRLFIGMDEN